jgi:hypothetical protein
MSMPRGCKLWLRLTAVVLGLAATGSGLSAQDCGPFTDVPAASEYCSSILEIYYLGITAGTTPTTFGPTLPVTRQVLAALLARANTGAARAGASRRAILRRFWTTSAPEALGLTAIGDAPVHVACDGTDVWVSINGSNSVSRVRGSDGKLLPETWTGTVGPRGVLSAIGAVFVVGIESPGVLYRIDPKGPAGPAVAVTSALGNNPVGIAFDGARIWTANASGSVSIVTPGTWSVTTVATGFTSLVGILYDGANIWVTDSGAKSLHKLNAAGSIVSSVAVGVQPAFPVFDGTNIWVPNIGDDSVTVVRASNGAVLTTLTGNGLADPLEAAFDGQRVLVTNDIDSVSLWTAADFVPIGTSSTGASSRPHGVCSDGIYFWIALQEADQLGQY